MIDKLEMFIALAKAEHFGRAAEECGVTQPTLSAAIKQLEEQLGVMLVWRGSRFRGLTPEGARVLEWARRIVGDTRTMREEMRAVKQGLSGKLRLAVIPTALSMVSDLTTPLSSRHPNLRFTVLSRTSADILHLIENLEIDAGITYLDNEPLGRLTTVPLYSEQYYLVARAGTHLCEQPFVTWSEVAKLPLCLLTPDMQNRRIVNEHLAQNGAEVEPRLESNSVITLTSHVLTDNWATILPLKSAEFFMRSGELSAVPIKQPEAKHLVGLVAPHREPYTPVLEALLNAARKLSYDPPN
ncbi:LysR family transcriptional regulator [Actibacterium lipolyticum]|uniref:Hydrogen peroxide-inducible genes activator n=1 Tax=Actibacterium lipolyticum TaxID=1524263 RepID=A0A238JUW6_9RHOB|nr:LysR family transcriptional regulator [Actibacterium lipolyticum]SMX34385.1 Hydrogen peroxide-inducible genes activator [Actibacterium lipolyticum]